MDFKNLLSQLSRIVASLPEPGSCRLEQRAVPQRAAQLDAAEDAAILRGLLERWLQKQRALKAPGLWPKSEDPPQGTSMEQMHPKGHFHLAHSTCLPCPAVTGDSVLAGTAAPAAAFLLSASSAC